MTMKATAPQVAVIGSGPAGVAAACTLRRLGHRVTLFGESRNVALEGLSDRTLMRLRAVGLRSAVACVRGPGERTGIWGGAETATSREYLVDRAAFDAALVKDAVAAGVEHRAEAVSSLETSDEGWRVVTRSGVTGCSAVIDARGRHARGAPLRGPRLVSLSQRFGSVPSGAMRTAIHAIPQGWCWLADDGRGMRWVQVVTAPSAVQASTDVLARIITSLEAVPEGKSFLHGAVPAGSPLVRAAVAKMSLPATARGMLRVGDASIAMDPLSGHGMHEALVSARAGAAAMHAYLDGQDWAGVGGVMNGRARVAWERMTQSAAGFYGRQAAHAPTLFWTQAASVYESLATAARLGRQGAPREKLPLPMALGG